MALTYHFFLGANSPEGFYSCYDSLIDLETAKDVSVIKAPPGGGKSSFMKRIAARLSEAGAETEFIHCSSDPESLDGVVFPAIGAAIVDGTAPHVVEPRYPYAVDRYLHLGAFVDRAAMSSQADAVRTAIQAYRAPYTDAYRALRGATAAEESARRLLTDEEGKARVLRRSFWIAGREFGRKSAPKRGSERLRFLDGITPLGLYSFAETPAALCSRCYEIEDDTGLVSPFLGHLREAALAAGQDVITCFDPLFPTQPKHLFLPGLGLGFVHGKVPEPYRRVRLSAYAKPKVRAEARGQVRLLRRLRDELLEEACEHLAKAKALHDDLERLYHPHVDFDGILSYADRIAEKLCGALTAPGSDPVRPAG